MNLDFAVDLKSSEPDLTNGGEVVKAMVVYEDAVVATRALMALNCVAHEVEVAGSLRCSLWKFDSLTDPPLLGIVADEALAADIVLIAVREDSELPEAVNKWLGLWPPANNGRPQALVAFAHGEAGCGSPSPSVVSRLEETARVGNMDFFATGGETMAGIALEAALARVLSLPGREPPCSAAAPRSHAALETISP